jgi:hypothetical protein
MIPPSRWSIYMITPSRDRDLSEKKPQICQTAVHMLPGVQCCKIFASWTAAGDW